MIYKTIDEWIEHNPNHIGALPIEVCRQIWGTKDTLAQPEQEPVGQLLEDAFGRGQVMWFNKPKDESMLYTTPPQRTWLGLTDEDEIPWDGVDAKSFAKAIEAKLKEKNNG